MVNFSNRKKMYIEQNCFVNFSKYFKIDRNFCVESTKIFDPINQTIINERIFFRPMKNLVNQTLWW